MAGGQFKGGRSWCEALRCLDDQAVDVCGALWPLGALSGTVRVRRAVSQPVQFSELGVPSAKLSPFAPVEESGTEAFDGGVAGGEGLISQGVVTKPISLNVV